MSAHDPTETTRWADDEHTAEAVARRILEKGILDERSLRESMEKYHRQDTRVGFVSFLVDEGLLTLDRLEEIHAELLPGAAAVEVRPDSRRAL